MGNALPSSISNVFDGMNKKTTSAEALLDRIHDHSVDNLYELRMAFKALDADNNGSLSPDEVASALEKCGFPVDGDLRTDLFAILDKDGDGKVKYGEFLRTIRNRDYSYAPIKGGPMALPECLTTQEALLRVKIKFDGSFNSLKETFRQADANNSGTITEDELLTALRKHGFELSEAMNRRIFTAFDTDGDGDIRFHELVSVLSSDLGTGVEGGESSEGGESEDDKLNRRLVTQPGRCKLSAKKIKPEQVLQAIHDRMIDGGTRLNELFDRHDADRNGRLSYPEIGKLLAEYGFKLDDDLMTQLLSILDKDQSGNVERNELVRALRSQDYSHGAPTNPLILHPELTTEEAILRVRQAVHNNLLQSVKDIFKKADKDNSGSVEFPEFVTCLEKLGLQVETPMARRLFAAFDRDGSNGIAYNEFIRRVNSARLA